MKVILTMLLLVGLGWSQTLPDRSDYPQARDAFKQRKNLPNLPKLNKDIYLKPGSLVCLDKNGLVGGLPHQSVAMAQKECYLTQATLPAGVADPAPMNWEDYYVNYHYGIVMVVLQLKDGTVAGFVLIRDLTN